MFASIVVLSISLFTTVYILNNRRNLSPEKSFAANLTILEGKIYYSIIDYIDGRVGYSYKLEKADKTLVRVDYQGKPSFKSGSKVQVTGTLSGSGTSQKLVVDANNANAIKLLETESAQSTQGQQAVTGNNKVIVVKLHFNNTPTTNPPIDTGKVMEIFNTTLEPFWYENSAPHGSSDSFAFSTNEDIIFGSIKLNIPHDQSSYCNPDVIQKALETTTIPADLRTELDKRTPELRVMFVYPGIPNCDNGVGAGADPEAIDYTIGGTTYKFRRLIFPIPFFTSQMIAHELGHTLNLQHANGFDCGGNQIGPGCVGKLVKDYWDIMGAAPLDPNNRYFDNAPHHLSAFRKDDLGWQQDDGFNIVLSGEYWLYPIEIENPDGPQQLNIRMINPIGPNYYAVEYRQPIGFDVENPLGLTYGVLIRQTGLIRIDANMESFLIDTTPNSKVGDDDFIDAALKINSTFEDKEQGIKVTPIVTRDDGAIKVKVQFTKEEGECPANMNYCPDGSITRAQMAVFFMRVIYGSDYFPPEVGTSTGFSDVPITHPLAAWIKAFKNEGITGGCGTSDTYCPEQNVTQAEMAVFLLRSKYSSTYTPPAVGSTTGFYDVPVSYWAAPWIKQVAAESIIRGCGGGNFCPESNVTRDQMAVFLLRVIHDSAYSPPPVGENSCFVDVPLDYWAAGWIKQLYIEGITGGCGAGKEIVPTPKPTLTPTPRPTLTPTPVVSKYSALSSSLVQNKATFNFTYSGLAATNFIVNLSLSPDMINGTFSHFVQGLKSPLVNTSPTSTWASYTCGQKLWWTVREDSFGLTSPIQSATVSCVLPSVPVLNAPATGLLLTELRPTLKWNASTPNVSDSYHLQIAKTTTFTELVYENSSVTGTGTLISFSLPSDLQPSTTYYWRVSGKSTNGESAWSTVRNFKTPISAPTGLSVTNTNTLRPTFTWGSVTGATSYTVELSISSTFTPLLTGGGTVTGITTVPPITTFTPTAELGVTARTKTVYYRVKAINATYGTGISVASSFTGANPPKAVSAVIAQPLLQTSLNPTFTWTAPAGALATATSPAILVPAKYRLQIGKDASFATNIVYDLTADATSQVAGTAQTRTLQVNTLSAFTSYYWRVQSVNTEGQSSSWYPTTGVNWNFKTAVPAPTLVTATNTNTLRPTFSWSQVAGANTYTLELSLTNTFTPPLLLVTTSPVGATSYTPTADMLDTSRGKTIYWRVKVASLVAGQPTGFVPGMPSTPLSFTGANPPKAVSAGFVPTNGGYVMGVTSTLLKWNTPIVSGIIPLASEYRLQVSTNDPKFLVLKEDAYITATTSPQTYLITGLTKTRYYWRIQSKSAAGNWSSWSTPLYFTVY